jgi:hypothetical protein
MSDIQLTGSLTIDSVDVTDYVSKFVIKRERSAVTIPATFGNIIESEGAGVLKEMIEITFFSPMTAGMLWAELYTAINTDSAELTFSGVRFQDAVIGGDNPQFSGTFVVMGLDTGADVGALRQQTQTYPITSAGVTKAIA